MIDHNNLIHEFDNAVIKNNLEALERVREMFSDRLPKLQNEYRVLEIAVKFIEKQHESLNHPDSIIIRQMRQEKYYEVQHIENHVKFICKLIDGYKN